MLSGCPVESSGRFPFPIQAETLQQIPIVLEAEPTGRPGRNSPEAPNTCQGKFVSIATSTETPVDGVR